MLEDRQFETVVRTLIVLLVLIGGCQATEPKLKFLDSPFEGYYEPTPKYWFSDYPWESMRVRLITEEG